jgi:hypothetical protein
MWNPVALAKLEKFREEKWIYSTHAQSIAPGVAVEKDDLNGRRFLTSDFFMGEHLSF